MADASRWTRTDLPHWGWAAEARRQWVKLRRSTQDHVQITRSERFRRPSGQSELMLVSEPRTVGVSRSWRYRQDQIRDLISQLRDQPPTAAPNPAPRKTPTHSVSGSTPPGPRSPACERSYYWARVVRVVMSPRCVPARRVRGRSGPAPPRTACGRHRRTTTRSRPGRR